MDSQSHHRVVTEHMFLFQHALMRQLRTEMNTSTYNSLFDPEVFFCRGTVCNEFIKPQGRNVTERYCTIRLLMSAMQHKSYEEKNSSPASAIGIRGRNNCV